MCRMSVVLKVIILLEVSTMISAAQIATFHETTPHVQADAFPADIFTLNRPLLFLEPLRTHQPGRDIIDWPLSDTHYPIFDVLKLPASVPYYEALVEQQKITMATPVNRETPTSFLFDDPVTGKRVKVMLTKPVEPGPSDIRS